MKLTSNNNIISFESGDIDPHRHADKRIDRQIVQQKKINILFHNIVCYELDKLFMSTLSQTSRLRLKLNRQLCNRVLQRVNPVQVTW